VIPRLSLLDEAARDTVHQRTLDVLERTGARYASRRALDLLRDAGAAIDDEAMVARLPRALVEEAVARAPRNALLAARDGARDALLDGSRTWLTVDGTGSMTLDHRSGQRRPSTAADVADAARVADAIDEIGFVWPAVSAAGARPTVEVLETLALLLANTGKHVQPEVQRAEEVPYVMEMLAAASEDGRWDPARPIFSVVYCPVSPLQHEHEMLDACLALTPFDVPICVYALGLAGATAPPSLAGGVVQTNAEILSAIVLFQIARPGLPVVYTADAGILDMRSGVYACAGPEAILMNVALTEMGRFYGLPVMATGLTSDAKDYSVVAGFEGGAAALASMLARPDALVGAGLLDAAQMLYLPKLVLDAEIIRQCAAVQGGLSIDEEHLAVELIDRVGPGGQYLAARETRRLLKEGEHYRPQAWGRASYDQWLAAGMSDVERAVATVDEILATHQPAPLPAGAAERVAAIVETAGRELVPR
jgi:trimethylamine:corrinoid methyltransferase-like protein